eukprot:CAMPEP_0117468704 /NCGR_PEP_ID=MMETSP0784-20121206/6315_1 /TAXON_ID=39447 /ORGANISM="" /LENGTH=561 /DNA_ID=CAMNT_0005262725 /DNA_START=452 /DNA_END=2135 /DNA_ORIENTATION=-
MMIWPWLVMASMIARIHIENVSGKMPSPFKPVRDLPFLGFLSAFGYTLTLMAAKGISITDAAALMMVDPILCAVLGSIMFGKHRRRLHIKCVKIYVVITVLVLLYTAGDQNTAGTVLIPLTTNHVLFIVARFLLATRGFYSKWLYSVFHQATVAPQPIESELLFYSYDVPQKHRFNRFPSPTLFTLDVIFDSGLRDMDFHAMGPLGTMDLHSMTEMAYLLPIASVMSWIYEESTIKVGIISTTLYDTAMTAQEAAAAELLTVETNPTEEIRETIGTTDLVAAASSCVAFVLLGYSALMPLPTPSSTLARRHISWKFQPLLLIVPFFFVDALYINPELSKYQMVMFLCLLFVFGLLREQLWNAFKRKYLLHCTQELQYYQPSCVRTLQQRTLLEFLKQTSIDDYGMLLLQTAIRHGQNMRELHRDISVRVWDPSPTSTAAWKLAFSLVTKSLKRGASKRKQKEEQKKEMLNWIALLVLDIVDKAVDTAAGHGSRLRHAGALASMFAKRRAIRQLRSLASSRRLLREKRKVGQLSTAPISVSTAGGVLRSIHDINIGPAPASF